MKKTAGLFFCVFLSVALFGQKGTRYLLQDDPMVGQWKFNADSSKHSQKPLIVCGEDFLELLPGLEVGMMAKYNPLDKAYERGTYFTLRKDSNKLYCSVTESYFKKMEGQNIILTYEYHKASDMLVIVFGGKRYFYSHVK